MIEGWIDPGKLWVVSRRQDGKCVVWHVSATVRGKTALDRLPVPWLVFDGMEEAYAWFLAEEGIDEKGEAVRIAPIEKLLPGIGEFMEELEACGACPVVDKVWIPGGKQGIKNA